MDDPPSIVKAYDGIAKLFRVNILMMLDMHRRIKRWMGCASGLADSRTPLELAHRMAKQRSFPRSGPGPWPVHPPILRGL